MRCYDFRTMFKSSSRSDDLATLIWVALLVFGVAMVVFVLGPLSSAQESDVHPTPDPTHPRVARYLAAKGRFSHRALYPRGSEEKRLLDAMLLAVPR